MMEGLIINNGTLELCTLRIPLVIIPDGVVTIGEGALKGCASIEEIILPESVKEIQKDAFKGCRKLKKINLPAGIHFIGSYAFHRCHSLQEIKLPSGITELRDCTFLYCDSLERISMTSVSNMGKSVFLNCTNLQQLEISSLLNENCLKEQFSGSIDISEIMLDGMAYPVNIFTENTDSPALIKKIAQDMFSAIEYEHGILTKYRTNLKDVRIPEGIIEIGKSAFFDRKGIISIKFPKTLKSISNTAFRNCISLESLEFQNDDVSIEDDAFVGCTTLKRVRTANGNSYEIYGLPGYTEEAVPWMVEDIHNKSLKDFYISGTTLVKYRGNEEKVNVPHGITIIGERSFAGGERIDCIVLPETIREIRNEAFCDCTSMQKINLPASMKHIGVSAFENCTKLLRIELPNITKLEKSTFNRCHKLSDVKFPDTLEVIGEQAFYQCFSLSALHFPKALKVIDDMAFYRTQSIREVILPESLEKLGDNIFTLSRVEKATICCDLQNSGSDLFSQCSHLKELTFSEGITHISDKIAFQSPQLAIVNLPKSLTSMGKNVFEGTAFLKSTGHDMTHPVFMDGRGLEGDIVIPDHVTAIAGGAFYENKKITSITLPKTLKNIGARAFCGCTGLTAMIIPEKIAEIKEGAFAYCSSLEKVTIHGKVRHIGDNAFLNCRSINQISKLHVESVGDNAFNGCSSLESLDIQMARIGRSAFANTPLLSKLQKDSLVILSGIIIDGTRASGEINIPSGIKSIAPFAFAGNENISAVRFPDFFESVGNSAFVGCKNLKEISFSSISEIGDRAFSKTAVNIVSGTISVLGEQSFAYCENLEKVKIKSLPTLRKETFTACKKLSDCTLENLVSIDDYCFSDCQSLTSFDFSTIKEIGKHAFENCVTLKEILLDSNTIVAEYAFKDCCHLEQITITDEQFSFGSYAFSGCTSICSICISNEKYPVQSYENMFDRSWPDIVKAIYSSVLSCFEIDIKGTIIKYSGNASFVSIPNGITKIGDDVFRECFNLCDIHVPASVTDMGSRVFSGTRWLAAQQELSDVVVVNNILIDSHKAIEEMIIPNHIKIIAGWAFANCFSLKKITLDLSKVTVREYAFRNCFNLKEIVTTKGNVFKLNSIHDRNGDYPPLIQQIFTDCLNCFKTDENDQLTESTGNIVHLILPDGIKSLGDNVYAESNLLTNCTFASTIEKVGNHAFEKCKWLTNIGNMLNVVSIGNFAFSGCQSLESIETSDKLQFIGKRAFEHCTSLQTITIPEGITEIPDKAFYRCKSLKEVILPSTIQKIGEEAFAFCCELEKIHLPQEVKIGKRAFVWCDQLEKSIFKAMDYEI